MPIREPLRFTPKPYEKVWGGARLASVLAPEQRPTAPLGEVWTLADRASVAAVVAEGRFAGRSLSGLMLSEREALLGPTGASCEGFPLLVKLLDTSQNLSVQVHPDARAARFLGGGAQSKTECWYVLAAERGAQLYLGLKAGVDAARFAGQAATHAVIDLLRSWPVEPGDFVFVPPGTVHAIGSGITLVEIQDNSDTTFRLYDWGRLGLDGKPRKIQLDAALKSIEYERATVGPVRPTLVQQSPLVQAAMLVPGPPFQLELQRITGRVARRSENGALVYVPVSGRARLVIDGREEEWRMEPWQAWLLPADLVEHRIEPLEGELHLLVARPCAEATE